MKLNVSLIFAMGKKRIIGRSTSKGPAGANHFKIYLSYTTAFILRRKKVIFLSKHAAQISLNPMDSEAMDEKRNIQRDYLFQAMFAAISGSPVSALPL